MRKSTLKIGLAKETLRHLAHRGGQEGPVGTEPNTLLPNHCFTASCKPHVC
jgi:hypothetical protein